MKHVHIGTSVDLEILWCIMENSRYDVAMYIFRMACSIMRSTEDEWAEIIYGGRDVSIYKKEI